MLMKRKTSVSSGRVARLHVGDASGPILAGKRWWFLGRVVLGVWKPWAEPRLFLTDHQHTARGEVTFMEMRKTSGSRTEAKPPADGRSVFVTGYNPRQHQRPEQNLFWIHPANKPSRQNKCGCLFLQTTETLNLHVSLCPNFRFSFKYYIVTALCLCSGSFEEQNQLVRNKVRTCWKSSCDFKLTDVTPSSQTL